MDNFCNRRLLSIIPSKLYDTPTNTSYVEDIRDQQIKETQYITWHSSSESSMFVLKSRVL